MANGSARTAGPPVRDSARPGPRPGRWRAASPAQRPVLERSDASERRLLGVLAIERALVKAAFAAGVEAGYRQSEAEHDRAWRDFARPIARPDEARREYAMRNLRNAEAGARRDADEQERAFIARAHATAEADRTDIQRATARLWPRGGKR